MHYIGIKLPPPEFRRLSIMAAEQGLSKSALLRAWALAGIKANPKKKGTK